MSLSLVPCEPTPLGPTARRQGGADFQSGASLFVPSMELQGRSPKRPLRSEILRIENCCQAPISRDPSVVPSVSHAAAPTVLRSSR